MRLRRNRSRPRGAIGPDTEVYILDVTERWYNNQHGYWAFTDPAWYAWATSDTDPPAWLVKANEPIGTELPTAPTRNDRILYLYHGGIMFHGGHFIGTERSELDAWLGDRQPLGVLEVVEETTPFEED